MALNHQHIYSTLRSALIDRDNDSQLTIDNAMIVTIGENQFALKNSLPSGAVLVAYSMLFRHGFAYTAGFTGPKDWMANGQFWLGGDSNESFPLFINDTVASIAIAVGIYAGILEAAILPGGVHIRPNFKTPMVQRTVHEIVLNSLTVGDAKELFISLMQDDQYRLDVPLADDYIANAFIAEFDVAVDSNNDDIRRQAKAAEGLE